MSVACPTLTHSMTVGLLPDTCSMRHVSEIHTHGWNELRKWLLLCFTEVMKNVRTVQYEELSEDQIKAARMRRSRDRCRLHLCLPCIPI